MTNDDILRMALEAGIDAEQDTLCRHDGWVEPMEKFAALVAAAERAACVQVCEDEIKKVSPVYSVTAENILKAIKARGQA